MVVDLDLARWRLRTQHLVEPHLATAAEVAGALLAVQAENPAQSAWAVAARTAAPDPADLAQLLDDGAVVRTHVLRPTWHYVAADDVAWLIELTAPRVRRTTQPQLRAVHGMSDGAVDRASNAVLEALRSPNLTRADLAGLLAEAGIAITGHALAILLADLELQALICSGRPAADGTHTYARFADRVRSPRGSIAVSHSPSWRCATSPGTVRRPRATWPIGPPFHWATCAPDLPGRLTSSTRSSTTGARSGTRRRSTPAAGTPAGHLLQILDEMYRGYQESRWVLDAAGIVPRAREAAAGMALVDAQLVAAMKRTVSADRVVFEMRPYRPLLANDMAALEAAASRYGTFLGRTGMLDMR